MAIPSLDRLQATLLISGLQQKDQPLYQVISQLISALQQVANTVISGGSSGGGSSVTNNIFNTIQQIDIAGSSSDGEEPMVIPGPPGTNGTGGEESFVPYYIAPTETFIVPIYKQALFGMNIDNEGILEVDGFLIEVDREGSGGDTIECCVPPVFIPDDYISEEVIIPGPIGLTGPPGIPGIPGFIYDNYIPEEITPFNKQNSVCINISTTGTINDLDFGNADIVRFTGAASITLTGLKAGYAGQIVTLLTVTDQLDLPYQTGSSSNNQLTNQITTGPTPVMPQGNATYRYDIIGQKWRLISHLQGNVINVAYNAANFTGNGLMTVTVAAGDQTAYRYQIVNKFMFLYLQLDNITIGGTPNTQIIIQLPAIYTYIAAQGQMNHFQPLTSGVGRNFISGTTLILNTMPIANWGASVDASSIASTTLIGLT